MDSPKHNRTTLHHHGEGLKNGNISNRIAVDRDHVGVATRADGTYILLPIEQIGGDHSGGLDPCIGVIPNFTM